MMDTLRDRGALVPGSLAQDMAIVCVATAAGSVVYLRLCRTRKVTSECAFACWTAIWPTRNACCSRYSALQA